MMSNDTWDKSIARWTVNYRVRRCKSKTRNSSWLVSSHCFRTFQKYIHSNRKCEFKTYYKSQSKKFPLILENVKLSLTSVLLQCCEQTPSCRSHSFSSTQGSRRFPLGRWKPEGNSELSHSLQKLSRENATVRFNIIRLNLQGNRHDRAFRRYSDLQRAQ